MTRFTNLAGPSFVRDSLRRGLAACVCAAAMLMALPASAQTAGVRAGASVDPDQFYFGGHLESGPIAEQLRFRPNIEVGLGSSLTLVALNFEFVYPFVLSQDWDLYAGAGPALNIISVDEGETDTEGGFNLLVGLAHQDGLFAELKIGTIQSPDVKIGVGYQFRWR